MKVAIVGTGNWGKNHVRVLAELLGEANVIACDLDRGRLKAIQERHPNVQVAPNLEPVLADQGVAAVVIATPAATHFSLAKQALEAGKHVLVEKPLALELAEAQSLIEFARARDRKLMVDHLLEYHPAVERLKELVQEGELGEIYYLYSQRLNLGVIRTEENALWSLGPHDISVFLYLLGKEPLRVSAHGGAYLQRAQGIKDVVFLDLEFADGVLAHAHLSWLDPQKVRRVVLVGSRRMAIFDDMARERLRIYDKGVEWDDGGLRLRAGGARPIELPTEEPLRRMAEHFLRSIEGDAAPRSDGRDGLRVLQVLAAAQRSLEEGGRTVALAELAEEAG